MAKRNLYTLKEVIQELYVLYDPYYKGWTKLLAILSADIIVSPKSHYNRKEIMELSEILTKLHLAGGLYKDGLNSLMSFEKNKNNNLKKTRKSK